MNWFSQKSNQDDDCQEIQRLSKEITDKITTINDFVKDKGFINEIRLKLTEIRSKIREFKITQTTVTKIVDELKNPIPDCKKALSDLENLKKVIDQKDSRIANLEKQLQDLSRSQNASVSQQELTKKQNNCKELCTTILTDINTKLAAIIPNFEQSGQDINELLNAINEDLSVPPRGYVEMKDMGRGNNGSDESKDSVSGSQSMLGRIGSYFSNKPKPLATSDSDMDSLYTSTSQINGVNPSINGLRSQLNRNDSNGSFNFDTRSRRDSDDYTDYDPNVQFQRSDFLDQNLTPEQLNSFTPPARQPPARQPPSRQPPARQPPATPFGFLGKQKFPANMPDARGGYYYSTSTSSSKRNKKSTRNRKKNKKNKKSRR